MERLERMPVPVLPTFVGALTLSNVYNGLGYFWIRHLTMWAACVVLACYVIKILCFPRTCRKEYENVIFCSLYPGFAMVMMILGSYFLDYVPGFGKGLFFVGLAIHGGHILVFTYRNVIRKREVETFVPSWFVTYNGILVSCVVGVPMDALPILRVVVCYGIAVYFVLIFLLIWRLIRVEIQHAFYHTMAVVLAPCSLCLVGYLNVIVNKNGILAWVLYACVISSLIFVISMLPKFFSFRFAPGFAAMTFPMAIGTVASMKMSEYLSAAGYDRIAFVTGQISGIQIYLTTMIIGFVLLRFLMMALRVKER